MNEKDMLNKIDNMALSKKYDKVYKNKSSRFFSFDSLAESKQIIGMLPSWEGLNVLEIGCGEGQLTKMMAFSGVRKVDAVDYSLEAIRIAERNVQHEKVSFFRKDYKEVKQKYDIVVMQGVLEHLDEPFHELKKIINLNVNPGGIIISSSPSFINPRGYIWMTLQLLFDIPMSLTDLHFLCPFDFEEFCKKNGYSLVIKSTDHDWAAGERTIIDFRKRLINALRDAGMSTANVPKLLDWLRKAVVYHKKDDYSGANVVYKIVTKIKQEGYIK